MNTLTRHFYRWGWLAPAMLPLTQLGGRALFTLVIWIYFLCGTTVVIRERWPQERKYLLLFGILLVSYALSIPFAEDPARAARKWINFVAMSSVFPITWMVLETHGMDAAQRLVKWVGLLGIGMVLAAYGQLIYLSQQPGFSPLQHMKEDSMPYLLPFILLLFHRNNNINLRWAGITASTAMILFYIFLSEGRAAQISAVLALFVFFITALNIRWQIASAISALCLLAAILGNMDTFVQISGNEKNLFSFMNKFTSNRWELWDNALTHAPDWNLIGCGMGNIRFIDEIVTFSSASRVAHLHNFILDIWYETGWLGLIAFIAFCSSILLAVKLRFASMPHSLKTISGTALASVFAILTAGLFSFSYNSKQFGVYLMLCLAVLLWSSRTAPANKI